MVCVLSSWVQDTPLQQFLLSCFIRLTLFSSIVWIKKLCIILLKRFVSMFNKEKGKDVFFTFHGKGCKQGKGGSSLTVLIWSLKKK